MGTGSVLGVTKVVDNGPDTTQWNLVIVGDGYTNSEIGSFSSTVNSFLTRLQTTAPFSGSLTWDRVNVYRMDVASDESGAINPATCPDGTTAFANSVSSGVSYSTRSTARRAWTCAARSSWTQRRSASRWGRWSRTST
ncbi:MAG: M64 family metallopeptidase [Nocardioides sp.]